MSVKSGNTYIYGVVWSEMRKKVAYRADVMLEHTGVILESQCECGAGQGPSAHCKHVVCVMIAAVNFKRTGQMLSEQTCTQVGTFWPSL